MNSLFDGLELCFSEDTVRNNLQKVFLKQLLDLFKGSADFLGEEVVDEKG